MRGSIFKRCSRCGRRVQAKRCATCDRADTVKWGYAVDRGTDPQGKRRQRVRTGFATKGEAEAAMTEALATLDPDQRLVHPDLTVAEYLRHHWLPAIKPPRIKPKTWRDRRESCENYVIPRIGEVKLDKLAAPHLNRVYAELLEEGRIRGTGGLSPATVHSVHRILRKAFNDAVRWGLLTANPTDHADPPPFRAVRSARRRSIRPWTAAQLRRFLEAMRGDALYPLWLTAATTGLRRSELLGLRWADVDLVAATVTVRQTVLEQEQGMAPDEDQKSATSGRTVHLDARTTGVLRRHREQQQAEREQAGLWQDHDLVFARPDGRWHDPNHITRRFGAAVEEADVPPIRLHDVRHTHATLLLKAGINPKVVSERLGHSSVAFTLDTYAHVLPGMQPAAAERFVELVFDASEPDEDPGTAAPGIS